MAGRSSSHFKDYYAPLSAPGQTAWVNLLKGEPLLILLDELPPYFENARSKPIGNSDLSAVTGTALANLFVALGKPGLQNVCLVITDLTASYQAGAQQIHQALSDLDRETGRLAMNLEPVRMNTDEFYHILRTRIFEKGPDREDIDEIAQAYARAVRDARIEHNEDDWRADAFLYCTETVCPECGWRVPMAPSWVIGEKTHTIASLVPDPANRRFEIEIQQGVSKEELAAARKSGTTRDARLHCPNCPTSTPIIALRRDRRDAEGTEYGLRPWENEEFLTGP